MELLTCSRTVPGDADQLLPRSPGKEGLMDRFFQRQPRPGRVIPSNYVGVMPCWQ